MYYSVSKNIVARVDVNPSDTLPPESYLVEGKENAAEVGDLYFITTGFRKPYTLSERRNLVLEKALAKRDAALYAPLVVSGKSFFTDKDSRNLMNQILSSHERDLTVFPANWLLTDGSYPVVSYEDMKEVNNQLAARTAKIYSNYYALIQQILASSNPESIDLNQGWQ